MDNKGRCGDYVYGNPAKPYHLTGLNNSMGNTSLNTLNLTYNALRKVSQITEAGSNKQLDFVYGNNGQRIRMDYQINSQLQYSRYYLENYDRQENSSTYKEWSYVYTPSGLTAVHYNNNGTSQLLYVNTDHLGSPITLTDPSGAVLEEYSFDPWGRRRNPVDWTDYSNNITSQYIIRGYTGHEHLDEVGIFNMNGRIYDPVLARFLQPDNFVQAPDNLQNFNRYGYVYNNPLKYTDPSGEIAGVVLWPMGYICNLVGNLIDGTANPFRAAAEQTSWSMGIATSALQVQVYNNGNTSVSAGIDPFALGISATITHRSGDFTYSTSGGIGIGGFYAGGSASYESPGGLGISVGGGIAGNSYSYGGSLSLNGGGVGYYRTTYGSSSDNPSGTANPQTVGGVSFFGKNWSFRVENDFKLIGGDGSDRWRTNAWELTVGKWSVGSSIYTNDARGEGEGIDYDVPNKHGRYKNGQVYSSPLWVGYRSGNSISRIGFSHTQIQHQQQNILVHKHGIIGLEAPKAPWFTNYDYFQRGIYGYAGFYNSYSLFGR